MERFAGRVALVTGVSSGIGEQVATLLVRAGLVVVGVARRQQRLVVSKTAARWGAASVCMGLLFRFLGDIWLNQKKAFLAHPC